MCIDMEEIFTDIFVILGDKFNYEKCLNESNNIVNRISEDLNNNIINCNNIKEQIVKYCKEVI